MGFCADAMLYSGYCKRSVPRGSAAFDVTDRIHS